MKPSIATIVVNSQTVFKNGSRGELHRALRNSVDRLYEEVLIVSADSDAKTIDISIDSFGKQCWYFAN